MITTIGEVLPSAAAVALSPFPVIAIVVVLGAPEARRNGVAFAGGWVLGLAALTGVLTALAGGASSPGHDSSALAWARVAVAVGLLALAV